MPGARPRNRKRARVDHFLDLRLFCPCLLADPERARSIGEEEEEPFGHIHHFCPSVETYSITHHITSPHHIVSTIGESRLGRGGRSIVVKGYELCRREDQPVDMPHGVRVCVCACWNHRSVELCWVGVYVVFCIEVLSGHLPVTNFKGL